MTVGEMLVFSNRWKEILSSKHPEIRQARLEVLLLDIEDAYANDVFASQLFTSIAEQK